MPTYRNELRVCKICGKPYHADVLTSSNTFSQSIESINREIRRHTYWLCDNCWAFNVNKLDKELEAFEPVKQDYDNQENASKKKEDLLNKKEQRYQEYYESIKDYYIDCKIYTQFLIKFFDALSKEINALNKPYKLYLDKVEFDLDDVCVNQIIGYLFNPTQKGPNISITYDLKTFHNNLYHLFPKIIIDSGYYYIIEHGRGTKVTKTIFSRGANWEISVEMQKKIRELMKDRYSWMESSYLANEIRYHQHIYFGTHLIEDVITILDRYYNVFGKPFEKIRMLAAKSEWRITVDENLNIIDRFQESGMRLFDPPFTDVKFCSHRLFNNHYND